MSMVSSIRAAASQAVQSRIDTPAKSSPGGEFARVLRRQLDGRQIAVSAHAADRMVRRGMQFDENTAQQLHTAFDLASQKGSREALFLLDDMAVIASVPDRVVKTALDRQAMNGNVFTNIDTTVVMSGQSSFEKQSNQSINLSPGSTGWAPSREAAIQPGGLPL